jgi:hypothetical protein
MKVFDRPFAQLSDILLTGMERPAGQSIAYSAYIMEVRLSPLPTPVRNYSAVDPPPVTCLKTSQPLYCSIRRDRILG